MTRDNLKSDNQDKANVLWNSEFSTVSSVKEEMPNINPAGTFR
jgi:hypothetical protein